MDGYLDVATRLKMAFDKYPDLRIQETHREIVEMPDKSCFIRCTVTIWRTADDLIPCVASACELYPGRTSFQKYSENEVGYTSAVGRALAYMGFSGNKSLASLDEVNSAKARQQPQHLAPVVPLRDDLEQPFSQPTNTSQYATTKQIAMMRVLGQQKGYESNALKKYASEIVGRTVLTANDMTKSEVSQVIDQLQK